MPEEPVREVKELLGLDVFERSLVGRAANRRKFICFKSERGGPNVPDPVPAGFTWDDQALALLEEALDTPADGEDEVIEKADSEETKSALRGALRILSAHKAKIDPEILKRIRTALRGDAQKADGDEPKPKTKFATKPQPPEPQPEPKAKPEKAEPKGNGSNDIPEMVMAVAKAADTPERGAAMLEAYKTAPGIIADLVVPMMVRKDSQIVALKAMVVPLLEERETAAVAKIVNDLNLPGERDDLIAFVRTLSPEQREAYIEAHKSTAEVAKSAVAAMGQAQGSDLEVQATGDTAYAEALRRAQAEVKKSDGKVTLADAVSAVFTGDPDLYERHCRETAGGG